MRAEGLLTKEPTVPAPCASSCLIVAWQDPTVRLISPVGLLDIEGGQYCFRYIRRAQDLESFRPILGFPELDRVYESESLFPFFSQRVMMPRRPDYERYLGQLSLARDAEPMEVLGRSQGQRHGDCYQLLPVPTVSADGGTSYIFLVNGIRHMLDVDAGVESRLAALRPGDSLYLANEETNEFNPRAILVTADRSHRIGWVPDLLLDYVHEIRNFSRECVSVVHVNGPDVDPHLRLMVKIQGRVRPGYDPLGDPSWRPIASV